MRFILVIFMLIMSVAARATTIEVFIDNNMMVQNTLPNIGVYNIDAAKNLLQHINFSLKTINSSQESMAHNWFAENQIQLHHAYEGLRLTQQYGLARIPAIVFDHDVVIEGTTDIFQALGEYRKWQATQKKLSV